MSANRDAITFPEAEIMVPLAVAFLHMMFAHAEFEEQVRVLQASIMKTPANRPHFLARLLRLSLGAKKNDGDLGNSRDRPKRIANLIKNRPSLVNDQEARRIVQIFKDAIGPCDGRNHLAHGRWWRFNRKTATIKVRSERKEEPKWDEYTEAKIRDIGSELRKFARDLNDIKRAIEHRRGDHDAPESDFET